jgi:hypothetical protein
MMNTEAYVTSIGEFDIYRIAVELSNGTRKVLHFEVRDGQSIIKTFGSSNEAVAFAQRLV